MPTVPKPEESSMAAEESYAEQQSGYKTCYGRVVKEPTQFSLLEDLVLCHFHAFVIVFISFLKLWFGILFMVN